MKIIALENMAGEEVYRKGQEYDVEDWLGESLIKTGHAEAVGNASSKKEVVKEVVEEAAQDLGEVETTASIKKTKRK